MNPLQNMSNQQLLIALKKNESERQFETHEYLFKDRDRLRSELQRRRDNKTFTKKDLKERFKRRELNKKFGRENFKF